jgi:hypothetical protein
VYRVLRREPDHVRLLRVTSEVKRQPLGNVVPDWPCDAQVVVVPGLPGRRWEIGDELHYPVDTVDFVKLVSEAGLSPAYARQGDASYVELKAAEHWLPVFVVAEEAIAAGAGALIADVIKQLVRFPSQRRTLLHARVGRARSKAGEAEFLEVTGEAENVLAALELFLAEKPSD